MKVSCCYDLLLEALFRKVHATAAGEQQHTLMLSPDDDDGYSISGFVSPRTCMRNSEFV